MSFAVSRRYGGLDGVRAVAVAMVIATHVDSRFTGGGGGVAMFFVLSGYLITSLLVREHDRTGTICRRLFYARRMLRLYPALLAMLAVTIVLGASWRSGLMAATYTTNLWNAFGISDAYPFGHTWSLALEEQYYLIWPLVLPLCLRSVRRSIRVLLAVAGASAGAAWAFSIYAEHHLNARDSALLSWNPLLHAHGLLIGSVLALSLRSRTLPAGRWVEAGVALLLVGLVLGKLDVHHPAALGWDLLTPEVSAVLLIIGLAVPEPRGLAKVFLLPPLQWMGRRSYAIYLWHLPLIALAISHDVAHGVPLAVIASFILAELSARFVEAPFMQLKDRLHPAETSGPAAQEMPSAPSAIDVGAPPQAPRGESATIQQA